MYNFIDGDYFESQADFSFGDMYSTNCTDPNYENLSIIFSQHDEPKIFIETHRLGVLFRELVNFQNRNCKIILHNSDATFGSELLYNIPNNVRKIWCQNYNFTETSRIISLPIGLERIRWFPEQKKQELLLQKVHEPIMRDNLIYMNFNISTSPYRKQVYDKLINRPFINTEMVGNGGDYNNYLNNLKKHKFVVSPPGNGIDCHRNWEALYLGCIPVIINTHFSQNVYSKNKVLIVNDFDELTEELLEKKYHEIQGRNNSRIFKDDWILN